MGRDQQKEKEKAKGCPRLRNSRENVNKNYVS